MTAAENMAMDETLLELKGQDKIPNTVRFLQFSPRAVLVGFHQAIAEKIRMDYCRASQIDINWWITGGGAIFFDENQLEWELEKMPPTTGIKQAYAGEFNSRTSINLDLLEKVLEAVSTMSFGEKK